MQTMTDAQKVHGKQLLNEQVNGWVTEKMDKGMNEWVGEWMDG